MPLQTQSLVCVGGLLMAAPAVPPTTESTLAPLPPELWPNIDHLVTEDNTPVDSLFSEKQMRLLTEPLYASWAGPGQGRPFLVCANVGLFYAIRQPPLVPHTLLSLDVRVPDDLHARAHHSYFWWEYGKVPEAVIEIVSNKEGGELDVMLQKYVQIGILYYAVFDPEHHLQAEDLRLFVLRDRAYVPLAGSWLPVVGLGLTLWQGTFEGREALWLRWCDQDGRPIPTGAEQAEQQRQRADQAEERAENAEQRAERLAAQLRALGVDPNQTH
jgi:hypothetical protein